MKSKKLLIIDDENEIRDFVAEAFAEVFDEIHHASNGKEGLEVIRLQKPDVILSDYNMPKLDGLELLKTLRSESIQIPVIWMTGKATEALQRDAWRVGVFDFFEKPFDLDQMKNCLQSALEFGQQVEKHRTPNFIATRDHQELKLPLEKQLYQKLLNHCFSHGVSPATYLHQLLDKELNK